MSDGKQSLLARIRKFIASTRDWNLRTSMSQLESIVADPDCLIEVIDACRPLHGLKGHQLVERLDQLLPELRSRLAQRRRELQAQQEEVHSRISAIVLARDATIHDHLRDFYFGRTTEDLEILWNHGGNDISENEKKLISIALRDRLRRTDVSATAPTPSPDQLTGMCPKCGGDGGLGGRCPHCGGNGFAD